MGRNEKLNLYHEVEILRLKFFAETFVIVVVLCFALPRYEKAQVSGGEPEPQGRAVKTTICELVSDMGAFEGKRIELRASILAGLETNVLYDKTCQPEKKLPARILFDESEDAQRVHKTDEYRKFWSLVHAYKESGGKRRSILPDKYTVTAILTGRFNAVGHSGQIITSAGHLALESVRDVVARPFDGSFLTTDSNIRKIPGTSMTQ